MLAIIAAEMPGEEWKALAPSGVGAFCFMRGDLYRDNDFDNRIKSAIIYGRFPHVEESLTRRGIPWSSSEASYAPPPVPPKHGLYTGKRVALVGPAAHITTRKQNLSRYDLIVRTNRDYPVKPSVAKTTGKRTDVWYPSLPLVWAGLEVIKGAELIIRSEAPDHEFPREHAHKRQYLTIARETVNTKTGCASNRGMIAIIDILAEQPKELYITGITFYRGEPYHSEYLPEEMRERETKKAKDTRGRIGDHDPDLDLAYFVREIANLPHVKLDKELADVVREFAAATP